VDVLFLVIAGHVTGTPIFVYCHVRSKWNFSWNSKNLAPAPGI